MNDENDGVTKYRKDIAARGLHKLTPVETPRDRKREEHDEITRQIAYYLKKGGAIKKLNITERKDSEQSRPEQDHHKRRF